MEVIDDGSSEREKPWPIVLLLALALGGGPLIAWTWDLPPGTPPPLVPADNPMSAAKVELGRRLFFDRRLSGDGTMHCGTCHRPELAFTDGLARPVGITGERHPRGAMALINVAYGISFGWDDPRVHRLEDQLTTPLFGHDPVEMGARPSQVIER
ncbi:MAG: cytochrome-c peroxidase, partial [Acidobacteriota bacterium]